MSTIAQAHALIDSFTTTKMVGVNLIKGNQDDSQFSAGVAPYVTQRVIFTIDQQLELGNIVPVRHFGYLLFMVYVPKGSGDGARNTLLDKVLKSFRSQPIGDVSMKATARIVNQGTSGQWALTGVQLPFYTDEF